MNPAQEPARITAGGAIFERLKALGIDYVFCNAGTDFPPIIEGLAQAAANDAALPQALVMPHEHAAMGMAHGYYQATGRMQAVMLHTNVGLANGAIGAINAACDHIPILIMSGRTPATEHTRFGARTVPIGWGQEMRDQTALIREAVKWDYELKFADQITGVLDRAYAIANTTPKGPVYLSLPREILCETIDGSGLGQPLSIAPARTAPHPEDIETLTNWILAAERPLIFAQRGTGNQAGFAAITKLVEDWAIPVCHYWAVAATIPTAHPMNAGDQPSPWLEEADLVIVLDSLAPWQPDIHKPNPQARIVHLGPDPIYARFPIRNFPSDLSIAGETADIVRALANALEPHRNESAHRQTARRQIIEARTDARHATAAKAATHTSSSMTKPFVARCLNEAIARQGRKTSIVSELGCPLAQLSVSHFNGYRQEPHAGGLGYGIPAALGIQLAEPETLTIATVGDGSYIFANPTACHLIAEALRLPVVVIVLNNGEWGAVRQSVAGLYPDGYAVRSNQMPLTTLKPTPDFCRTACASRAYSETVEHGGELPAALDRAIAMSIRDRRQALLDVKISG